MNKLSYCSLLKPKITKYREPNKRNSKGSSITINFHSNFAPPLRKKKGLILRLKIRHCACQAVTVSRSVSRKVLPYWLASTLGLFHFSIHFLRISQHFLKGLRRILYLLMTISVGDFLKFSIRTLVNPYREFTISFGKRCEDGEEKRELRVWSRYIPFI